MKPDKTNKDFCPSCNQRWEDCDCDEYFPMSLILELDDELTMKSKPMNPGDIVEIFTGEHSEGKAELVKLLNSYPDAEYWIVRFPDGWTGPRLIKKQPNGQY